MLFDVGALSLTRGRVCRLPESQSAVMSLLSVCAIYILHVIKYIVQCWGHSITPDHQIYRVTPLKTPFRLLIPLLKSSPVTTFTHNYLSRCVTFTQLTILHIHNYNHYPTLTRLHWLTSQLAITNSNYHTLCIFTLPVSVSYRDLARRTAP
jgi:hypothetical protein